MSAVPSAARVVPASRAAADPLPIRRVDAIPVAIPLTKPMLMAGVRIERAYNLIVRVEAGNGLVGWGEATCAPTMTGDILPGMLAAIEEHLAPLVTGKNALMHAALAKLCAEAIHGNTGPKAALDMAIVDLAGRHLNVTMSDLLGGALRESVRPMWLLGNKTVEEDIAETKQKQALGINFFKLKLGVKPVDREIAATHAMREAVGPDVPLCADANMGYDLKTARRYVAGVADCNLLFLEQPLRYDDMDGMAALARSSPIPIGGDEAIGSVKDIRDHALAGAIAGVNLKTIKMGGMGATVHAAQICEFYGLGVKLAGKVAESSIAAAALVHIGCVIPNLDWGISNTNNYLADDLVQDRVLPRQGVIEMPRGPGLGVTVDEQALARLRLSRTALS